MFCPHCESMIDDDDALSCLYCGKSLERPIGVFGKLRYPSFKMVFTVVVLLLLFSFIALVVIYWKEALFIKLTLDNTTI